MRMSRLDPERTTLPPDGRPLAEQPIWRQDFPIHLPEDEYVSRRDFTKFAVLVSLAFVVGQAWILVQNAFRRAVSKPPLVPIADLSALAPGSVTIFHYPGPHDPCFLARLPDGQLLAYSQVCTHLSCAVIPDVKTGQIHCPCHDGLFDLATGRPLAGPPPRPLPRIYVEVRGGRVYATGVEARTV